MFVNIVTTGSKHIFCRKFAVQAYFITLKYLKEYQLRKFPLSVNVDIRCYTGISIRLHHMFTNMLY